MAEFNSYLLGKARKSVGNLTIVYAKGKNIVRAKVFGRKDNPTPEVLVQRMKVSVVSCPVTYSRKAFADDRQDTPRVEVVRDGNPEVYRFLQTAEEAEEGFAALDDKVYGVLLERALQRVRLVPLKSRGVAGETEYTLPEEWDASKVNVYCFATSSNERMVSDSVFVPVTPQA